MKRRTATPTRMCLGCSGRTPQAEMHRIAAAADGSLRLVSAPGHTGRSGYLHRDASCLRRFAARKGPVRSLGRSIDRETRGALLVALETA